MRKFLAFLLLAGAATPALAAGAPGDRHGWQSQSDSSQQSSSDDRDNRGNRGNRSGGNGDRPHADRGDRGDRGGGNGDRPHADRGDRGGGNVDSPRPVTRVESNGGGNDAPRRMVQVEPNGRGNDAPRRMVEVDPNGGSNRNDARFRNGFRGRSGDGGRPELVPRDDRRPSDTVRDWRGPKMVRPTDVAVSPNLRQPDRPLPRVFRNRVPVVSGTPREGTQPALRVERRHNQPVQWSSRWRNNHRYDWQDWRRHHRSTFHLGFYYDPFGWNYRPYQIGWRLWPSYFSSRYWISDPWEYRLPYAPPGTRWIRYYDDAVLVDTWDGEVVDVIYNFFW